MTVKEGETPALLQILSICHITFKQHEKLRERPCTILCEGCQTQCGKELSAHSSQFKFTLIISFNCAQRQKKKKTTHSARGKKV